MELRSIYVLALLTLVAFVVSRAHGGPNGLSGGSTVKTNPESSKNLFKEEYPFYKLVGLFPGRIRNR
jgi:hypothetical protein